MDDTSHRAVAVVGVGAIMPGAPTATVLLGERDDGGRRHLRGRPEALGPRALLRCGPEGSPEDLLEDRRLGPRFSVGAGEVEAPDPAARRGGDGRGAEVGDRDHARDARRLRLARAAPRPRPDGGDPRERDGGRKALPDLAPHRARRVRGRAAGDGPLRGPPAGRARPRPRRVPRADRQALSPGHRGHDAGRAVELHRRADREPLQLPRSELRHRRRLRLRPRGDERGRRRPRRGSLRHGSHRRPRPEHGPDELREVLQDRRALGHRVAALRGRGRRLRHGRGSGVLPPQAPRRRRARRRQDLLRHPGHRRLERRARQGAHRPEPGRPALRAAPRLGDRGPRPGHLLPRRGARHVDEGRRRRRGRGAHRGVRCGRPPGALHPARLGQVEHRPPEGGCGRGRFSEDDAGPRGEGRPPEPQLPEAEPEPRLVPVALLRQHRAARRGRSRRAASAAPGSRRSASAGRTSTSSSRSTFPAR